MAGKGFPSLPTSGTLGPSTLRQIAIVVNGILAGKQNNVTTLTLTANSATTTFQHPLIGPDSSLVLAPLTAHAGTEFGAGAWYWSSRGKGTAVMTHTNNAQTDRAFSVEITG